MDNVGVQSGTLTELKVHQNRHGSSAEHMIDTLIGWLWSPTDLNGCDLFFFLLENGGDNFCSIPLIKKTIGQLRVNFIFNY
jgi:hypothetical protein